MTVIPPCRRWPDSICARQAIFEVERAPGETTSRDRTGRQRRPGKPGADPAIQDVGLLHAERNDRIVATGNVIRLTLTRGVPVADQEEGEFNRHASRPSPCLSGAMGPVQADEVREVQQQHRKGF